jgi:hypothetical protein
MLRWSRHETDTPPEAALPHAAELEELAAAQTADDDGRLRLAREALVAAAGPDAAADAIAVAANFEMMTRLADGTGAMQTDANLEQFAGLIDELQLDRLESVRRPE